MEHEAETYQQRLQAIAERRQIQEEQERARREMEDERLRLQQLKRKSLRDQWLMEGPPASPDSSGPRSPIWGSKAQEIETHINKLQEKSEQLAEEEVKLKKLIEDDSESDTHSHHKQQAEVLVQECVRTAVATVTTNGSVVVENGKEEKEGDSRHADIYDKDEIKRSDLDAEMKTNASAVINGEASHSSPGQNKSASVNGFSSLPAEGQDGGTVTLTFLGFKEAEPGHGVDEEDDGGAIIRAERVIITDEGEDVQDEEDGSQELTESDKKEEESSNTGAEDFKENNDNPLEAAVDLEVIDEIKDVEIVTDVVTKDENLSDFFDTQTQNLLEESQAPGVSTSKSSSVPKGKQEDHPKESQTQKEKELVASIRISLSQLQEVPLDESKPGPEQEPLLVSKAAQMDTSFPNPGGNRSGAKRKTCQCCSIM